MRKALSAAASFSWASPCLGRGLKLTLVVGFHLLLLGTLASMSQRPPTARDLAHLDLRIIEEASVPQKRREKSMPLPAQHPAQSVQAPPPAPVMTTSADAVQPATAYTLAPQPKSIPLVASPATHASAPVAVTPPRFDADYLHNPLPAYPRAARRYGDQGRVLLKVRVSAQGTASAVELESSSGHARLDEAAQETVRRWRFVPARRGAEAIDDWVLVPVVFRLDS